MNTLLRYVLVALLLSGVALGLGLLLGHLTRVIYPLLLVPAVLGAMVGAATGFLIHLARLPARAGVVLLVLGGWVLGIGAFHTAEFRAFTELQRSLAAAEGVVTTATPQEATDQLLERLTGSTGLPGFLLFRARAGLRFRLWPALGHSSVAAVVFWSLEQALGLWVALSLALRVRRRLGLAPSQG